MVTTATALTTVLVLAVCDRYTRRHPAWSLSARARFFISCGYPMVLIAAYFLVDATSDVAWVFGAAWALAAACVFTTGFGELSRVLRRQHTAALSLETISDPAAMQARS